MWKSLVMKVWNEGAKAALTEFSLSTENKWDDMAIGLVDKVINQVLK